MPQKLNKAGKMQDYIPAGNGDPSGEYGTSKGTNKNFTTSDKKKTEANVITENKSVVVGDKGKSNSIEELKKQKDLAEKEMDKYVDYADKSWMPKYQDEEKRAKYYEAQRKFNELRKEINKLEDKERKKERIRKEANEKIQELHKISDRIIDNPTKEDKELFDKKMDEYEKWEKENSEKTIDYREYFKDKIAGKYAKKDNKANIIDNDLTGKKEKEQIDKLDTPEKKETFKEALTKALENAKKEYDKNKEDGGTANLDSCEIYIKNANLKTLENLVSQVDPSLKITKWDNGVYHIMGYSKGQGNLRTRMVEAFEKTLNDYGFKTYVYSQAD